jgi:hypothetical protein
MYGAQRSRLRPTVYGALAGGLLGLSLMVLFTGKFAIGSIDAVLLDRSGPRARPEFVVSSGGLYLLIVVAAVAGALAVAGIIYAFGRESEPMARRFSLASMLPVAAVTGAVFGYGTMRAGLGAGADIDLGIVTVSTYRMAVVISIAGVVTGGVTANVVDALARPATLGLEGEALPQSLGAFLGEMQRAVGSPMVSVVVLAVFAIGLSQLLLAIEGTAAVALFAVVGAVVLAGATLAAYRPWDRPRG